jgi:hypothetical protein
MNGLVFGASWSQEAQRDYKYPCCQWFRRDSINRADVVSEKSLW